MEALLDPRMLLVSALGAVLSLDRRAAVQAMLAHPLVAAPLVGLALGDVEAGLGVGLLVGLLWSGALPVGGVVPPDETLGAIAGTAVAILAGRAAGLGVLSSATIGFVIAIPAALIGRRIELGLRRLNGELAAKAEKSVSAGDTRAIERTAALALTAALGVAFLAQLVILAVAVPAVGALLARNPGAAGVLDAAAAPVPFAGIGGVIVGAGFRIGLAWATLGFALGVVFVEVRA